jgi:hypothetical protein
MRCCVVIPAAGLCFCLASDARGQADAYGSTGDPEWSSSEAEDLSLKEEFLRWLPPAVSEDLEIDAWAWLGALHQPEHDDYWDADLSLAVTKSFDQKVAITAQGDVLGANGDWRAELRQGYISTRLSNKVDAIFTIGKFNANFGVEPRDFWNRSTGTTSLLFGAQPQDIVGMMLTYPLGDDIKLRPFISADFQGDYNFDQSPAAGIRIDYQPHADWMISLTQWVGPGFVLMGGRPLDPPYPLEGYGEHPEEVIANWQGPHLMAEQAGTLYFVDANATWRVFPDLTLAGEFLLGTTNSSSGTWGWHGWMGLARFDVTDHLHAFGRFCYLDDPDWLITGFFQTRREVSCGFGYEILDDVEIRGEYRHDFSNAYDDVDTLSIHLTLTY